MYTLTRLPSKGTAGRRSNMSEEQGGQKGYTVLTMSESENWRLGERGGGQRSVRRRFVCWAEELGFDPVGTESP